MPLQPHLQVVQLGWADHAVTLKATRDDPGCCIEIDDIARVTAKLARARLTMAAWRWAATGWPSVAGPEAGTL